MLERQERSAVLVLILVMVACGCATVIFSALGKEPFVVDYSPDIRDGTLVRYQGVISHITETRTGGSLILELSGTVVFISPAPQDLLIAQEDSIRVFGIAQTYKGKREIMVSDPADVVVLERSQGKNLRS
ncbi:MAG TPA: hypothetical protein VN372_11235 [Methanospirillum sp.]|nr:hypothetical protein [Methanospirillum sp.]